MYMYLLTHNKTTRPVSDPCNDHTVNIHIVTLIKCLFNLLLIFTHLLPDGPPGADAGKSDTLGSTGSVRKRGGGAKKAMQANKSALRAPRALCCLTLSNPIRMAALALVEWKYPFF